LESFKDSVFSRAGEAVEDNDHTTGGSFDRLAEELEKPEPLAARRPCTSMSTISACSQ
jgi:hypothetical protein